MKNKVLAATTYPLTKKKTFTVMIDVPYCLLPELLQYKELDVTYEKLENIRLEEVYNNTFIPTWIKQQGIDNEILETNEVRQSNDFWLNNLDTLGESTSFEGEFVPLEQMGWQTLVDNYNNLLKLSISKQHANLLLSPFAYTTCIITGTAWNSFFEEICPKYELENCQGGIEFCNSKNEFLRTYDSAVYDTKNPCSFTVNDWQSINKNTTQLELQQIAEEMYDLCQETKWKESGYHIPFEEDILNLYSDEILDDGCDGWVNDDPYTYAKLLMKISASMCANFSTEGTFKEHLNNKQFFIHQQFY